MTYPPFFTYRAKGIFFFRLFGYGLWAASYAEHRPLFSERNGYRKTLARFAGWRVLALRPEGGGR